MITEQEDIRDIFNIFHDGDIFGYSYIENNLSFSVEIPYLANRVNPKFSQFFVTLYNCQVKSFHTWPSYLKEQPKIITDIKEIFKPRLWILEGNIKDATVEIVCSQADSSFDYCGGTLYLTTDSAKVLDEAGKDYSVVELADICEAYWEEWSSKGKKIN